MGRPKSDGIEMAGERLLLTEPTFASPVETKNRYALARERYLAYHNALELILEPGTLALVDKTLKAQHDMDACMVEYAGGRMGQTEERTPGGVTK